MKQMGISLYSSLPDRIWNIIFSYEGYIKPMTEAEHINLRVVKTVRGLEKLQYGLAERANEEKTWAEYDDCPVFEGLSWGTRITLVLLISGGQYQK